MDSIRNHFSLTRRPTDNPMASMPRPPKSPPMPISPLTVESRHDLGQSTHQEAHPWPRFPLSAATRKMALLLLPQTLHPRSPRARGHTPYELPTQPNRLPPPHLPPARDRLPCPLAQPYPRHYLQRRHHHHRPRPSRRSYHTSRPHQIPPATKTHHRALCC